MSAEASASEPPAGHVIVCGLGHVGSRCADLLAALGSRCVVVALSDEGWRQPAGARRFDLLCADARSSDALKRAGVERASALIAATGDDLANASIALQAKKLNPRLVTVARIFDLPLGSQLERAGCVDRAFSTSALAAPAFEAAVRGGGALGALEAGVGPFVIESLGPGEACPADGAALARQLGERWLYGAGAHAASGGRLVQIRAAAAGPARRGAARLSRAARVWLGLREAWHDVPRAQRIALLALLAVVALSVAVFQGGLGLSLVDALYFVVTTITTTGYGDINLQHASAWLKLYGALLMICGAGTLATLFGIVTNAILSTRFRDVVARSCARDRGHVVVVGLGSIGYGLFRQLIRRGELAVAVERDVGGPFVAAAREIGPVVTGDARSPEILRRAGLGGARALVAATDDDLANLSVALATKLERSDCRVVLRLFDDELAERLASQAKLEAVLSVSSAAAPTLVAAALGADAQQGLVLGESLVAVFCQRVEAGSRLEGLLVSEAFPGGSALFVRRGGALSPAARMDGVRLAAGDEVVGARWYPLAVPGPGERAAP